jgi:hypothetical protein
LLSPHLKYGKGFGTSFGQKPVFELYICTPQRARVTVLPSRQVSVAGSYSESPQRESELELCAMELELSKTELELCAMELELSKTELELLISEEEEKREGEEYFPSKLLGQSLLNSAF